jgi:glycosyltransferase involved in cell wall biosynthesis
LSVLITARDEAEMLPGALASVTGLAAETVVVVDPRSTDATREVAAAAGARVLDHPFESCADQLAWGLERCAHDWVLMLDADERLTPALGDAVVAELAAPRHAAYAVRRANYAFGRRLRFGDWGGDRVTRLVDRRAVRLDGGMHTRVRAASTGRLAGLVEHHTLRSLDHYLPKLHAYARHGAAELVARGVRAGLPAAISRAEWRFLRAYFIRLGVLDGMPGLVVAILAAHGTFLKWAAVWEATAGRRPGAGAA